MNDDLDTGDRNIGEVLEAERELERRVRDGEAKDGPVTVPRSTGEHTVTVHAEDVAMHDAEVEAQNPGPIIVP
jgi:hypothetical protein